MLLEIRQTSLSRTLAAPMLVPQPSVLIQTELSPVFELEEFGFRFCDDGRILAGSYRLRPFLPCGRGSTYVTDWQACGQRNRVHGLKDVFCYEAICRCPFASDVSMPHAFVCRESKEGPVEFWTKHNTGYSLDYDHEKMCWMATFTEPLCGLPSAANAMLAGFRFDQVRHRLVGGDVYAADLAGGLLQLRTDGGSPSVELDERVYDVSDSFSLQLYDDFAFQKYEGQDRVILQRGEYLSCFETRYGFVAAPENSLWTRLYAKRSPIWKSNQTDQKSRKGHVAGIGSQPSFQHESQSIFRRVFRWFL